MPRILYIQYTDPTGYPPLEHSSQLLAGEGWDVLFLGTRPSARSQLAFTPNARIQVRRIGQATPGWRQKIHYVGYCLWVTLWAIRWRPEWIYASDALASPLGYVLRCLGGRKVLFHEHDAPQVPDSPSMFLRVLLAARRRLARAADVVVVPNRLRADILARDTGRRADRIHAVWNCARADEVQPARGGRVRDPLRITYHGNLGPDLLPRTILQAMAHAPPDVRLRIVGYATAGHAAYPDELLALARQLGVAERVECRGAIPRHELLSLQVDCDLGLALFRDRSDLANLRTLAGASNKTFDYLAGGLALLVADRPDWRSLFVAPGYALACDPEDPGSISAALQWCCENREALREMGERGRRRILEEWNYGCQFAPVMRVLQGTRA